MRTLDLPVPGLPATAHVVEGPVDYESARDLLAKPVPYALDVESTGLDIFSPGYAVRTVQLGHAEAALVIPVVGNEGFIRAVLAEMASRITVAHNAPFDILSLDAVGLADWSAYKRTIHDTRLLAHLLDPRGKPEGGVGHGLKDLADHHLGEGASDLDAELKAIFRANGWKKADGYANVDIADPTFLMYAASDVVLTARLFDLLGRAVHEKGLGTLYEFERHVQSVTMAMERRGMLLDVEYAKQLSEKLVDDEAAAQVDAHRLGIENVNSPAQVADRLLELGAHLPEKTATGAPKVDRAVLEALASDGGEVGDVALAVLRAKRAGKFRTSYVEASLDRMDVHHRVHPHIQSLQARTARMAVSGPPLQQLPSKDAEIRSMFIADPGCSIVAVDYSQVELRVLAALAEEKTMLQAIADGEDLHSTTAAKIYGADFTKYERKIAKTIGFGKVYGGGAATLSRQSGAPIEDVRSAIARYDREFPGVKKFGRKLQDRAEFGKREVVTPSGRHLPLDRDRLYAATNYVVQSTARDVVAQALCDLDDAGLTDRLLMVIHDEVLADAPDAEAKELSIEIARVMAMDFRGVHLAADPEVYGRSWGDGYR